MSTPATIAAPAGYKAGTWTIDPVHSDVSFTVRHMMVSKVRGRFGSFSGTIVTAENPAESTATASIDVASFDTNNEQRDAHIRSKDFLELEAHPTITFTSTGLKAGGEDAVLVGDLTIHGTTRSVELALEVGGFGPDAYGGYRAGFTATTKISRKDFGVDLDMPLEGGGVVIGDKIDITLEIEAVLGS